MGQTVAYYSVRVLATIFIVVSFTSSVFVGVEYGLVPGLLAFGGPIGCGVACHLWADRIRAKSLTV